MRLNKLTGLVLLCLAFFSSGLVAQDFSAQNSKYTPAIYGDKFTYEEDKFYYFNELAGVLFLKGKIEKGMYKDFRQAITDNKIHTLVLDSPGGNVSEGLQIAGTVFDRKIKTYIRKNQNCASACSFIFLSGKTRYTVGKLGVHQIAFDEEFSKKKEEVGLIGEVIQITNSDIVQYLDENNTPGFVYKYMLRTPSDEMYYFSEDELNQLGNSDVSSQDKLHFNRIDNFTKDYNSHIIKQKCDTNPNSCTTSQLCARAAKNNAWRTSLDASKFVKIAKSKGIRCGIPIPVCPEDIKKCTKEYLCTYGTTGLDSSLSWLNNSFANEAKTRGYSCGIVSKPITKTGDQKCDENPLACSSTQLCQNATTYISKNNRKVWQTFTIWKPYVSEAKKRGLSCGVKSITVKNVCENNPQKCTPTKLCKIATIKEKWSTSTALKKYVEEAKRRGLSCGVQNDVTIRVCAEDTNECSNRELCNLAVRFGSNPREWTTNQSYRNHINEAQRRGLSCGIGKSNNSDDQQVKIKKVCTDDPKICNRELLCKLATIEKNSYIVWEDGFMKKYAAEAKRRGLACGVKKKAPIINEMVRSIHKQLNRLGCNAGTTDGILGRKTLSALKRWKSAGGNYTPNKIDQRLRSSLFESPYKCSSAQTFSTTQAKPGLLSGTWNVIYSRCDNKRYRSILSLYNSKFNEYEATYPVHNRIYKAN